MFIYLYFDASFPSENVDRNKFHVDIDPTETIDNLKVIISLKYTDLDPNSYDIFYREKRLESFRKIIEINLQENDILAIKGVGASCNCLLI